jgi:hypothetical protein
MGSRTLERWLTSASRCSTSRGTNPARRTRASRIICYCSTCFPSSHKSVTGLFPESTLTEAPIVLKNSHKAWIWCFSGSPSPSIPETSYFLNLVTGGTIRVDVRGHLRHRKQDGLLSRRWRRDHQVSSVPVALPNQRLTQ